MTHFGSFALQSNKFSLQVLTVCTYFTIIFVSKTQTCKTDLTSPSEQFSMIIVGFFIRKNMSTSDPFA